MFRIDPTDPAPIHAQLARAVRAGIATGALAPGDQLPTVRQLAVELRVNANTVAKVYAALEREGLVDTHRGLGTFVRTRASEALRDALLEDELRLRSLRFVADAATLGFTVADVINHLQHTYRRERS